MPENAELDTNDFRDLVAREFPDLLSDMNEYKGLETLQAMVLRIRTQGAIEIRDIKSVRCCFALADRLRVDGNDAVRNAIHVSFLENLDFRGPHGQMAFAELFPGLRDAWVAINEYMDKIPNIAWVWKGPRPDQDV